MKEKDPFSEILEYIEFIKSNYNINLVEYENEKSIDEEFMKKSLNNFITTYNLQGLITGTRKTDPHSQHLKIFNKSDSFHGWPNSY